MRILAICSAHPGTKAIYFNPGSKKEPIFALEACAIGIIEPDKPKKGKPPADPTICSPLVSNGRYGLVPAYLDEGYLGCEGATENLPEAHWLKIAKELKLVESVDDDDDDGDDDDDEDGDSDDYDEPKGEVRIRGKKG